MKFIDDDLIDMFKVTVVVGAGIAIALFFCAVSIYAFGWLFFSAPTHQIVLDGNLWKCTAENTYTQVNYIQVGNVSTPQIITVSECVSYGKK